ncbi:hypothetical protein FORC31_1218 [Escherichia coli]|nr:hypothetical protein FORC31_1218 [Escherichia coli]
MATCKFRHIFSDLLVGGIKSMGDAANLLI